VSAYLDLAAFKARTIMPENDVDVVGATFVASRLAIGTSEINGLLRKRYATPFVDPVPEVVLGWLTDIVTPEIYERRGWNPGDAQSQLIIDAATRARAQMKEAADSVTGLWELPLRENTTADGISKGGPLVYSEQSPWTWTDVQADHLRGGGT